jgi:GNAT superfamily N-acetyltransferase
MEHAYAVYENLRSLLRAVGKFPGARYQAADGLTLCDAGVDDAYENYALLGPGCQTRDAIAFGLEFFARAARPHIWPLFPEIDAGAGDLLEAAGLERREDFRAMTSDVRGARGANCDPAAAAELVSGEDDASRWARTAWRGFDSEDDPPEQFVSNVILMARSYDFSLMRIGWETVGMLFASGASCGIYYVATIPEARGRGLAGAIVEGLKSRAREIGYDKTILLATPAGRHVYLKHGFEDGRAIRIYSKDPGEPF